MTDKELIMRLAEIIGDMPPHPIIDGGALWVKPEKYNEAVQLINAWIKDEQYSEDDCFEELLP